MAASNQNSPHEWMGLLNWSMKFQDGTYPTEYSEMTEEKKQFLRNVMDELVIDEVKRIRAILDVLMDKETFTRPEDKKDRDAEEMLDYKERLVEELVDRVEDINNAKSLELIGGFPLVFEIMMTSEHQSIRAGAAATLAAAVQNHESGQQAALKLGALPNAMKNVMSKDFSKTLRNKSLLLVSCLVRGNEEATRSFVAENCVKMEDADSPLDGLGFLFTIIADADIKISKRGLFLLRALFLSDETNALQAGIPRRMVKMNFVRLLLDLVSSESMDIRENAIEALDNLGARFLPAVQSIVDAGGKDVLSARVGQIEALTGDDRTDGQAELDFLKSVLQRISDL